MHTDHGSSIWTIIEIVYMSIGHKSRDYRSACEVSLHLDILWNRFFCIFKILTLERSPGPGLLRSWSSWLDINSRSCTCNCWSQAQSKLHTNHAENSQNIFCKVNPLITRKTSPNVFDGERFKAAFVCIFGMMIFVGGLVFYEIYWNKMDAALRGGMVICLSRAKVEVRTC